MQLPALPAEASVLDRSIDRRLVPRLAHALLRLAGWRVVIAMPVPRRCVVVFYPHTSNWDFVLGLAAKGTLGVDFRWIGKHTLFRPPFARWFERWGGIAVDRADPAGLVESLAARFASKPDFALVITPEGTRSRTANWKSGFYRLALAASLPIGLAFIDRRTRTIGIGTWLVPTGDAEVDLAAIRGFYADKRGWTPGNAGEIRFRDRSRACATAAASYRGRAAVGLDHGNRPPDRPRAP